MRTSPLSVSLDWLTRRRDLLLVDLRFQRWAKRFPLTRPIARQRARALFDLCGGFVYSQILLACVRLRICEIVFDAPLSYSDLASRLGLTFDATKTLLDAAVSLELLSRRGDKRCGIGRLGAALIANPGIAAMVEHHVLLYADLADPEALLRGTAPPTELSRYWAYANSENPEILSTNKVAGYTALMAASQSLVAEEVLDSYRMSRHRRLLDVAGGDGSFLCAVARRAPHLELGLFDLPSVTDLAIQRLTRAGLSQRVNVTGGDFRSEPLPRDADVISLIRVIHDHDDDSALGLLRAAHDALPKGGTLVLAEPMSRTPGAEPIADAYFGFYLLAMGSGRPRSAETLTVMLANAGFGRIRLLDNCHKMLVRVLLAQKK